MRRFIFAVILTVSVVFGLAGSREARAALDVATYIDLTVARLQLAQDMWEQEGRGPSAFEEELLCQQYGATAKEYYAFRSAHPEEVDAYLAAHPEVQVEIERLSARIEELTAQVEGR